MLWNVLKLFYDEKRAAIKKNLGWATDGGGSDIKFFKKFILTWNHGFTHLQYQLLLAVNITWSCILCCILTNGWLSKQGEPWNIYSWNQNISHMEPERATQMSPSTATFPPGKQQGVRNIFYRWDDQSSFKPAQPYSTVDRGHTALVSAKLHWLGWDPNLSLG